MRFSDARARRQFYARAGLCEPIPPIAEQRLWCWIDDRQIPEGEPDGTFDTYATWLNKAASWIGWTGAKCYDAQNRRCRNGSDFNRARDEGAFPVRWYWPDRFAPPVPVRPRVLRIRLAVANAGDQGTDLARLREIPGLRNAGMNEVSRALEGRRCEGELLIMSEYGREQTLYEALQAEYASYVR